MTEIETTRIEKLDILNDVKNPRDFPWPYGDQSVQEVNCLGVFEFIPGKLRGKFMDEVYRILVDNGKATFTVPYWNQTRGYQDYRLEWPPICEQSFLYFNKGWREANKLELDTSADFDFTYGYAWEPDTAARNDETRSFRTKYYSGVVEALQLVLTKRPYETKT